MTLVKLMDEPISRNTVHERLPFAALHWNSADDDAERIKFVLSAAGAIGVLSICRSCGAGDSAANSRTLQIEPDSGSPV
eukprot:IDg18582t1